MTADNWKTLRVPPEAYEQAKQQKQAHGRTWGEQLVRPDDDTDDVDEIVERLRNELSMGGDPTVEVDVERVMRRLDELEERLPERTASRVEDRFK